jgi:hypothetical protein
MTDVTPPPAPQPPAVPADTSTEVAPAEPKKSGALGGFALFLAIQAVLGDIVVILIAIVTVAAAFGNKDASDFDLARVLASFSVLALVAVIDFFGGLILAVLGILLGIIAIASRRGRVAGVFAVILSILVLITHGSVFLAIAQTGDLASNFLGS